MLPVQDNKCHKVIFKKDNAKILIKTQLTHDIVHQNELTFIPVRWYNFSELVDKEKYNG